MTPAQQAEKRLDVSIQARNLELELLWKRSLFFWGFIASAFAGYAVLKKEWPNLSIVTACFGMVCTFAWCLLNRGSKYWQESWETKVNRYELDVTGPLFAVFEDVQTHKGWLRARKFSVSKLIIGLSDYVFCLWSCIVSGEIALRWIPAAEVPRLKNWSVHVFAALSLAYICYLWRKARTSSPSLP